MKPLSSRKIALGCCFLALITGGIACEKLVAVPANAGGQLVTGLIFTDSVNATAGVLGLYASPSIFNREMELYTGMTGDELLYSSPSPVSLLITSDSLYAGTTTSPSPVSDLWASAYSSSAIYQTNAALEGLAADADSALPTALRNQLIGECEVVRAFYYFNLVNVYGGVPLVTGTFFQTNRSLPRASVDAVYGQITKDLLDARARMTATYPSPGRLRPNRYTADALLARTYLYRGQWDSALAMADTVIQSGLYSLTPSLDNVFLDGSPEAIWQVGSSNSTAPKTAPGNNPYKPGGAGRLPLYSLTQNLPQAFETGDTRKTKWIGSATGLLIALDPNGGVPTVSIVTYPYSNKYRNVGNVIYNNTTEDLMMIRLAEMYLIRAEARARLGDLAGAMQDVNTIRSRAGLTSPVTAATLPDALGFILHERQVEFFCEWGHRWMDLKRMDSINPVLTREKPSVWPADGHIALYPISFGEIQADPYLKQNPGY